MSRPRQTLLRISVLAIVAACGETIRDPQAEVPESGSAGSAGTGAMSGTGGGGGASDSEPTGGAAGSSIDSGGGGEDAEEGGAAGSGGDAAADAGALDAEAGTGGAPPDAEDGCAKPTCTKVACQGKVLTCGNCLDDDGDGLVDMDDPDCLTPCSATEANFYYYNDWKDSYCKEDCFFDWASGSGDDDCYWNHHCDPLEVAPDYYPAGAFCAYNPQALPSGLTCAGLAQTQSAQCLSFCAPLVPNGCDFFGCCELPAGSGKHVYIGGAPDSNWTCSASTVTDPKICPPCTPVKAFSNSCEQCELCVGKTTLPPQCAGKQVCAPGAQPCGFPCQPGCPSGQYCLTGCCTTPP